MNARQKWIEIRRKVLKPRSPSAALKEGMDVVMVDVRHEWLKRLPETLKAISGVPTEKMQEMGTVYELTIQEYLDRIPGNGPIQVRVNTPVGMSFITYEAFRYHGSNHHRRAFWQWYQKALTLRIDPTGSPGVSLGEWVVYRDGCIKIVKHEDFIRNYAEDIGYRYGD